MEEEQSLPPEICIYNSKGKLLGGIAIMVGLSVLFFFMSQHRAKPSDEVNKMITYVMALLMGIGIIMALIKTIQKLNDKTPQIIIDAKGIQLVMPASFFSFTLNKPQFYAWQDIGQEYAGEIGTERNKSFSLTFISTTGDISLPLAGLDITADDLNYWMLTYRKRSGKKFYSRA